MAGQRYPSEFDWRYMTISTLVFPDRNPAGHVWASAGIVLCGLCGLCWAAVVRSSGIPALRLGFFCMAFCAVLPERLLPVPKGHEILALVAFFALCFGIVQRTFGVLAQQFLRRTRSSPGAARLYASLLAGAALSPIVLAGVAQAYVSHALPALPWVSLAWRALRVPPYLSFAFWEWVTCGVFSAYIAVLAVSDARTGWS